MTSFQQSSNERFLKPLIKVQFKAAINYLVVGILFILVMTFFIYVGSFWVSMSGSDRFELTYKLVNPLVILIVLCVWGMNFGVHLCQNDVNKNLWSFVMNRRLIAWVKQIIFLTYAAIIAFIILGAIYMLYVISYVSGSRMIDYLTVSNSAISFLMMWLLLFTSMNLGYLFALIKVSRMAQLLVGLYILVLILIFVFKKNDMFLSMISCSIVFSLLCLLVSYKGILKEGEA